MAEKKLAIPILEHITRVDANIMQVADHTELAYPISLSSSHPSEMLVLKGIDLFLFSDLSFEERPTETLNRLGGIMSMMEALKSEFGEGVRFKARVLTEVHHRRPFTIASAVYAQIGSLEPYNSQQLNQRLLEKVDAAAGVLGVPLWAQTTYNPIEFATDLRTIIDKYR